MRDALDLDRLHAFMAGIGKAARSPGRIYLVGGATALLLHIRKQTIDVDIKLDPEPGGVFESIALLKDQLNLNVELAAPDQFMPPLPNWRERSEFIARQGQVEFYHYDFYGQALAKILRGHGHDLSDAQALIVLGKVDVSRLMPLFEQIAPELIRYPAIDIGRFRQQVSTFVAENRDEAG
jgi:hypothetical protein